MVRLVWRQPVDGRIRHGRQLWRGGSTGTGGAAGASALPPSCAANGPGLSDRGETGESCCASVMLPGGTFYRTYSTDAALLLASYRNNGFYATNRFYGFGFRCAWAP
jgi:hypothetical protein